MALSQWVVNLGKLNKYWWNKEPRVTYPAYDVIEIFLVYPAAPQQHLVRESQLLAVRLQWKDPVVTQGEDDDLSFTWKMTQSKILLNTWEHSWRLRSIIFWWYSRFAYNFHIQMNNLWYQTNMWHSDALYFIAKTYTNIGVVILTSGSSSSFDQCNDFNLVDVVIEKVLGTRVGTIQRYHETKFVVKKIILYFSTGQQITVFPVLICHANLLNMKEQINYFHSTEC